MLPGIRFIFVTVILSASVLIFGLGAAALLRVSHEEFATLPSWRTGQPQFPPTPVETSAPTLAMLRIETPEAKTDATAEGQNPALVPSNAELGATPDKSNTAAETPSRPEASEASAEKVASIGGQPDPVPAESPAPNAITAAPMPAIESPENAVTDATDSGAKTSEAAASETQADQSEAAKTKADKTEAADLKVAEIKPPELNVAVTMAAEPTVREVRLQTIKVHATKPKPVAKKKSRSGIYAMAQRRRAAARARAIARARAAQIEQQRLAATDPLAALFGITPQPSQVVQTPHQ